MDMDEAFARNMARLKGRYRGLETGPQGSRSGFDEEDDMDMSMYAGADQRMTDKRFEEHQRQVPIPSSLFTGHRFLCAVLHLLLVRFLRCCSHAAVHSSLCRLHRCLFLLSASGA